MDALYRLSGQLIQRRFIFLLLTQLALIGGLLAFSRVLPPDLNLIMLMLYGLYQLYFLTALTICVGVWIFAKRSHWMVQAIEIMAFIVSLLIPAGLLSALYFDGPCDL